MTTEERLEKLEKDLSRVNRRNRWLLAGVGLCIGALVLAWAFGPDEALAQAGAPVPKETRASGFGLVDAEGRKRAELVMSGEGPALRLYDENGKTRAALAATKFGGALVLWDKNGELTKSLP